MPHKSIALSTETKTSRLAATEDVLAREAFDSATRAPKYSPFGLLACHLLRHCVAMMRVGGSAPARACPARGPTPPARPARSDTWRPDGRSQSRSWRNRARPTICMTPEPPKRDDEPVSTEEVSYPNYRGKHAHEAFFAPSDFLAYLRQTGGLEVSRPRTGSSSVTNAGCSITCWPSKASILTNSPAPTEGSSPCQRPTIVSGCWVDSGLGRPPPRHCWRS